MQIGCESPDFKLFLNGQQIPPAAEIKYLGLTIRNSMKWQVHIENIGRKASKTLGMIRRCLAFNTIVRPIVQYATQVWSPHTEKLSKEIDKIHRKAIRWVYKMKQRDSVIDKMKENNIMNLAERRKQQDLVFLRKIEFGLYDIQLESYIKMNKIHNTRNKKISNVQRLDIFKYHFYNRMASEVKVLILARYKL
jgi:hypothetical protein